MKNICFFNSIRFWGGGEKLHLENAIEFKKKGYNVIVLANPQSLLWDKAKKENIKTFPVTVGNLSFLNPLKLFYLIRLFRKEKVDTIIFSSSQDLKTASISSKLAGVQRIVYLRGLALPIKATFLSRFIFSRVLTHIISNSEETKRTILQYLGKYIPSTKVHTIYHGIEIQHNTTNNDPVTWEIAQKGHGIILGNAGRLTAQKGHENLIKVAKILKEQKVDFSLFIAGTGELETQLKELIHESNLDEDVFLLGFVENMNCFMKSIDVFLLTSIWEGFGYVLVEAMSNAKPVVAFNITSNPEIITANKTGFLIEYPYLESFADKTLELIRNEELRREMGIAGKKSVEERFILHDRVAEIEEYLNRTINV